MKQIEKTEHIVARLRQALGDGVDVNSLRVYEAIALNTRPLRKNHPLYRGSRAERSLLLEMAAALAIETRPIQIQHNDEPLPIGRVFHGEVVDRGMESELRVLFFLDPTADDEATKIDAGSVDQVSVSILPKQILSSASGFDFLGPDSTYENVITGTDPDGNTIGENGVYGRLIGLDKWFELSLVGMGGAQNARIVSREQSHFGSSYQKLAASGVDPNALVLVASTRNEQMDLTTLIAQLTDTKVDLASKVSEIATLAAAGAAKDTRIAELEAKLAEAGEAATALAAKDEAIAAAEQARDTAAADLTAAVTALQGIAKKVLAAAGKVDAEVPATVAEIEAIITETSESLVAALVPGGRSKDAIDDAEKPVVAGLSAFRVRRK